MCEFKHPRVRHVGDFNFGMLRLYQKRGGDASCCSQFSLLSTKWNQADAHFRVMEKSEPIFLQCTSCAGKTACWKKNVEVDLCSHLRCLQCSYKSTEKNELDTILTHTGRPVTYSLAPWHRESKEKNITCMPIDNVEMRKRVTLVLSQN